MVMDSGIYPMGRLRVFAWETPEGKVSAGYFDWTKDASTQSLAVPEGFVGIESVQMRGDMGMVRIRRWSGRETCESLVDVRQLACTDVGFLELWKPCPHEAWRSLLEFDETGDVKRIDWDAVLAGGDELRAALRALRREPFSGFIRESPDRCKYAHFFRANFDDRASLLAWRHGKDADALWESIVGKDADAESIVSQE
jgi:hypothetical protein